MAKKSSPATVSPEAERSLAEQRAKYEAQLGQLQEQSTAAQQSFASQLDSVNRLYEGKQSSLKSQLDEQRSYYDTLLNTLNTNLADTKTTAQKQKEEYDKLAATQQEQLGILSAERDRAATDKVKKEQQARNSSTVYQNSLMTALDAARRLRTVRGAMSQDQSNLLR